MVTPIAQWSSCPGKGLCRTRAARTRTWRFSTPSTILSCSKRSRRWSQPLKSLMSSRRSKAVTKTWIMSVFQTLTYWSLKSWPRTRTKLARTRIQTKRGSTGKRVGEKVGTSSQSCWVHSPMKIMRHLCKVDWNITSHLLKLRFWSKMRARPHLVSMGKPARAMAHPI